jgi:hypothetical protein
MDIKSLEINLFKTSEIEDGDTILVKIDDKKKSSFKQEDIRYIYDQIKQITKKNISIYFFPKHLNIDIIKHHIQNIETNKEDILKDTIKDK